MEENYAAALFDGEGSFNISMSKRIASSGRPFIQVAAMARIGMKPHSEKLLKEFCDFVKVGKIYHSNNDNPKAIVSWQTTRWSEIKLFVDLLGNNLKLKNKQAIMMLEAYNIFYLKYSSKINKNKNRDKADLIKVAELSLNMNKEESMQAMKRNEEKGMEYLKQMIEEVYAYNENTEKDKGGMPPKYTDEQLLKEILRIVNGDYNWQKDRKWKELAKYRYGSWEKAVELSKSTNLNNNITKEE